jgi:hypothetical protein
MSKTRLEVIYVDNPRHDEYLWQAAFPGTIYLFDLFVLSCFMMRYSTDLCRPVPEQHSGDTPPEPSTTTLHLERNVISFHNRATGINAWCDTLMNVHTKRWLF